MSGEPVLNLYLSEGPPVADLAREAQLIERAADGEISLFLTSWRGPVVVLGYGQAATDVDLEWCRSRGMPVLRRLTGGTGVVHKGDLGVGLALPQSHLWAQGIISLYDRFLNVLEPALRSVGADVSRVAEPRRASRVRSPICFLDQLADTLVVDGKKAVGCAQTRRQRRGVDSRGGSPRARCRDVLQGVWRSGGRCGMRVSHRPFPDGDWGVVGEAIAAHLARCSWVSRSGVGTRAGPREISRAVRDREVGSGFCLRSVLEDWLSLRTSREVPPSTLCARIFRSTWNFVCPTILKMAPPPHAGRFRSVRMHRRMHATPNFRNRRRA